MPERFYQLFFADLAAEDDFYPKVTEVEVTASADQAATFRLRVGLPAQADGEWADLEADKFALFTKVRLEAGFQAGSTEVLAEGYITEVNAHFEDPARAPYLEVSGLDASVLLSLEEKIVAWPDLSDSDIATQIIASYGFTPDVTNTQPVHAENEVTLIQRGTDLSFLRQLARKNGFETGVERDFLGGQTTGYFRAPRLDGTPQKTLAVAFGEATSLKSFAVQVDGLKPLDVQASQIDVKAKAANTGSATAGQQAALGRQDLAALVSGPLGTLVSPREAVGRLWLAGQPAADLTELTALAQAVREEAGWLVTARGEINSEVYGAVLRPNRLVLIKGAGARYSGKYYVTQVTHRIKRDGAYEQSFQARRNAVGLDGSENFGGGLSLPF